MVNGISCDVRGKVANRRCRAQFNRTEPREPGPNPRRAAWSALCHSRMLFARAYPRETEEMLSDRPGLGSIKKHARDPVALREQFLLSTDVARDRVRRTRALIIEIPTGRSRQLVLARSKPGLGYTPLMKIARG
jgi:hypothetical protein